MSVATFIPTIWNARLLANLDNEHVATEFVNRDYEGEIKQKGDKVKVNSIGEISIKKYNKDADIDDAEDLTTEDQDLTIDQGDYFNFKVNDVDRVQAAGTLMDKAMQRASYGLSQNSDAYIFSTMATGAGVKVGTSVKATYLTSANAYSTLVDIKIAMDKANVPKSGRKIAVPPEMEGLLLLDQRFVSTGSQNAETRLANGLIGRAAGFDIYVSNNLPYVKSTDTYTMIAAVQMGTSYAEQIVKTKAYQPEKSFSDAVKGLQVYGCKVFIANCVCAAYATFTAPTEA